MTPNPGYSRGFTLVEATMTIAVAGIVFAAFAMFLQRPVQGYLETTRRAEISDIADTALRRMQRDLRLALPNSVRVDATGRYLEFLITSGGGRYRSVVESTGAGNVLDFESPAGDASFDVIGAMPAVSSSQQIVIFNLGTGFDGADAYQSSGNNRAAVASASGSTITLSAAKVFPNSSPGKRFHVIDHAVTYECDPATRVIRRYWSYGINATQVAPPTGGSNAVLATQVSDCAFAYNPNELLQRYGTVAIRIALTSGDELLTLQGQAHVPNIP